MTPPIAEVAGKHIRLKGEIEVGYEDGKTLLIPETHQAASALNKILEMHPNSNVTISQEEFGDLTIEGDIVNKVDIETKKSRVLEPEPVQPIAE